MLTRAINGGENRASVVTDDVTSRYEKRRATHAAAITVADINRWRLSCDYGEKFAL